MAEQEKLDKPSKSENKKEVFVPRSAQDVQRMKLEKLMNNPDKQAFLPNPKKEWKPPEPKDFVRFVMGSSAGAGSGEFHVYRATRRREYNRLRHIEEKAKEEEADERFHKKLDEDKLKAEERTARKRAKRSKKKQKKQAMKKMKSENAKTECDGEQRKDKTAEHELDSDEDSDEERT